MQDDAGVDAGEQTSSVTSSSSSGGRGGSGTTTTRPAGGRAGGPGSLGSAGGMARAGRGGNAMTGKGGAGGEGGKAPAADGGKKAPEQGGEGGEKAPEHGGAGGEGGKGGEKAPEQSGAGGEGGAGGASGTSAQAGAGAGAAGMAAAGSGGTSGGTMLTMLTAEQKTALCARIDDGVRDQPLMDAVRGYCSSLGLRQPAMCAAVRDACFDGPAIIPVCIETIPDCPSVTEDEFVVCRVDNIKRFVDYNRVITCDNPNSIPPGTPEPMSCMGPYARCPALRNLVR
jgi:hypothetical protein